MRAWLLLLAVLATFQPIVQVASTEDISSRFITAISPQRSTESISTINTKKTTTTTTNTKATTALSRALIPVIDTSITDSSVSSSDSSPSTSTSAAASSFLYANSDSDNIIKNSEQSNNNNLYNNIIVEIKNIDDYEGNTVNEANEKVTEHKVPQTGRTDQLENSKNKNKITNTIVNSSDHIEAERVEQLENQSHEMAIKESENTSLAVQHREHHHHNHQYHHQRHHHHQQQQHHPTQHATTATSIAGIANSSSSHTTADHQVQDHADSHQKDEELLNHHSNSSDDVEEDEAPTYSNKEIISESIKPDPSTLVQIENSLLSLFNMKRKPKIDRSKIVIPEAMKQLYAQIMGHELDSVHIPRTGMLTKSANTVRSFTHQDSKIDDRFPHHHRFRLHFDIKSIPAEEKLKAAELQLARDAISHAALNPRLANRTRYQVLVYDITRVGIRGKREPSYLLLDNKTIRLNSTETVSLDVQPAVDRWLEMPKKNYGLLVEVRTMRALKPAPHHHVRLRRSADEPHDNWQHKQPLLITYTDDERHKPRSIRDVSNRSKRAGHHRRPHRRKNNEEICRRHSLYVDFADVGWSDWIVAPPGYDAFYCQGKCPFPLAEHLNSTNHAVVQTLVNNVNPAKAPKACCVPTQLEGISMLYLNDQNTVVLKNYQDMTAVGCGCR